MMSQADIITGLGVLFILIAFLATTFAVLKEKSKAYYILNIIGAALACYGSILIKSVPFTILEAIWTVVAIIGLLKIMRN